MCINVDKGCNSYLWVIVAIYSVVLKAQKELRYNAHVFAIFTLEIFLQSCNPQKISSDGLVELCKQFHDV